MDIKPGKHTSEFILTIAAMVIAALMALVPEQHTMYPAIAGVSASLAAAGYTLGRSLVKARAMIPINLEIPGELPGMPGDLPDSPADGEGGEAA